MRCKQTQHNQIDKHASNSHVFVLWAPSATAFFKWFNGMQYVFGHRKIRPSHWKLEQYTTLVMWIQLFPLCWFPLRTWLFVSCDWEQSQILIWSAEWICSRLAMQNKLPWDSALVKSEGPSMIQRNLSELPSYLTISFWHDNFTNKTPLRGGVKLGRVALLSQAPFFHFSHSYFLCEQPSVIPWMLWSLMVLKHTLLSSLLPLEVVRQPSLFEEYWGIYLLSEKGWKQRLKTKVSYLN